MEEVVIKRLLESNAINKEEIITIMENKSLFCKIYLLGCIDME